MKRNMAGLILTSLAAFFVASGIISGGRLARAATTLPGTENATVIFNATGASYLNPVTLRETAGANISVTDTITGITPATDSAIAIWTIARSTIDTTNHWQLAPQTRTVVFDRTSATLVNCCDANINGNGLFQQSGIAGYAFPVAAKKRSYAIFDTVLDVPEPVAYTGTATVNGVRAYVYSENVRAARAARSPMVPAQPAYYSVHQVFWVDPQTGLVLKTGQAEDLYVTHTPKGAPRPVVTRLFAASLRMTPASVARLVSQDAHVKQRIAKVAAARLACFWLAGALAVTASVLFVSAPVRRGWQRRARPTPPPADDQPPADQHAPADRHSPIGQHAPADQLRAGDQ